MAKKTPLTTEEVTELFSELDESGVLDPARERERTSRMRDRIAGARVSGSASLAVDPLSTDDPSGSKVDHAISRAAVAFIVGVLVLVVGVQIWYGVNRRLNTANLSVTVNEQTVRSALEGGVEWGEGFTQFPNDFIIDEADQAAGVVEVSVVDTSSANELELFSNSQIQAAALATNALLNDNIDQVTYNVSAYVADDGSIAHDRFFGLLPAMGTETRLFTFIWTKNVTGPTTIGWDLKIVGLDDEITERIQEQVNSVSSLIVGSGVSQDDYDAAERERRLEQLLKGEEIFRGGPGSKTPEDVLESLEETGR